MTEYRAAETDAQRTEVVGLARQIDPRFFLVLLPQALVAASEDLRLSAARDIGLLAEQFLPEGVRMGVAAPDADIRAEVLNVAANALPKLRPKLLGIALQSSQFPATRLEAAQLLMERPDQPSFAALLPGLDDQDARVREKLTELVESKVAKRFKSASEAQAWWAANQERFDAMLLEIPVGVPDAP